MNTLQAMELAVLEEGREWTRLRLQQRLQAEADAVASVCPRSARALRDMRRLASQVAEAIQPGDCVCLCNAR